MLKREAPASGELDGLIRSGSDRLRDASNPALSTRSRFDLAYGAAHALALAALRRAGYRTSKRYVVFLTLTHTIELPTTAVRVLGKAHDVRNRVEYEGADALGEQMVADIIAAAHEILARLSRP